MPDSVSALSTIARGSFTVIDYNDAASITAGITSNKPLTILASDGEGATRSSVWTAASPNIINPVVLMSSKNNPIDLTQSNDFGQLTSIIWRYKTNTSNGWVDLALERDLGGQLTEDGENGLCSDHRFKIVQVATQDARKFALLVACDGSDIKGATNVDPLLIPGTIETIEFKYDATFTSNDDIVTPVSGIISYNIHIRGNTVTSVLIYTPDGNVFTKSDSSQGDLTAIMEFWRGAKVDFSDVAFRWYLKKNTVFAPVKITGALETGQYMCNIDRQEAFLKVGSTFRFTDAAYDLADVTNGTITNTGTGAYTLDSDHYYVTAINYVGNNKQVTFTKMNVDGTLPRNTDGSIKNVGLSAGKAVGTLLISDYWDYHEGGGWAVITASTANEGKASGLGTASGGPWINPTPNTSSKSDDTVVDNIVGGNVLVVPKEAVKGMQVFKGVAEDLDPSTAGDGTVRAQTVTFLDYAEPYQVTLYSDQGDKIKNKSGWIHVEAQIWHAGELLTAEEINELTFAWELLDKNGDPRTGDNDFKINDGSGDGGASGIMGKGSETYNVGWKNGAPVPTSMNSAEGVTIVPNYYTSVYLLPEDISSKGTVTLELMM